MEKWIYMLKLGRKYNDLGYADVVLLLASEHC